MGTFLLGWAIVSFPAALLVIAFIRAAGRDEFSEQVESDLTYGDQIALPDEAKSPLGRLYLIGGTGCEVGPVHNGSNAL